MNKSQLIDELAERFDGNRKVATHALDSVVDVITRSVSTGERVVITGFGVFERSVRKAGTARNPRTGETVKTRDKFVAKFRPGSELKDVVSGARIARRRVADSLSVVPATAATAAESATRAAATGLRAAADVARGVSGTTPVAAARKSTAANATATARPASAKKTSAKKTTAKKTSAAKKTTAKKTSAAKKTTAKKTSAAKKTLGGEEDQRCQEGAGEEVRDQEVRRQEDHGKEGAGEEVRDQEVRRQEDHGKEGAGQEDRGQEVRRQEDHGQEDQRGEEDYCEEGHPLGVVTDQSGSVTRVKKLTRWAEPEPVVWMRTRCPTRVRSSPPASKASAEYGNSIPSSSSTEPDRVTGSKLATVACTAVA